MATMGERIKQLRKENGWTQTELAEKLHVSCVSVSKWENGISIPTAKRMPEVADALHTTVGELLESETRAV